MKKWKSREGGGGKRQWKLLVKIKCLENSDHILCSSGTSAAGTNFRQNSKINNFDL